jgi:hypothetical protein
MATRGKAQKYDAVSSLTLNLPHLWINLPLPHSITIKTYYTSIYVHVSPS